MAAAGRGVAGEEGELPSSPFAALSRPLGCASFTFLLHVVTREAHLSQRAILNYFPPLDFHLYY